MALFHQGLHWTTTAASVAASLIAMSHNFVWHKRLTFKDRTQTAIQAPTFLVVSCVGIGITSFCAHLFDSVRLPALMGQVVGIGAAMVWNYTANNLLTWRISNNV